MIRSRRDKQSNSSSYRLIRFFILFVGLSLFAGSVYSQRITYQDLLKKDNQPNIYVDHFLIPALDTAKVEFVTMFRVDYKLLRFKKYDGTQSAVKSGRHTHSFEATTNISLELFGADNVDDRKKLKNTDYQKLKPSARKFWEHTVYADTYEQTKSNRQYLSGYFKASVAPGLYRSLMQLTHSEAEESIKRTRTIRIHDIGQKGHYPFYYIDSLDSKTQPRSASIINFGNNVYYGKDFYLLFQLPSAESDYELSVNRVMVNKGGYFKKRYGLSSRD